MSHHRWLGPVAALVVVAAALANPLDPAQATGVGAHDVTPSAQRDPAPPAGHRGHESGLPWSSGVTPNGISGEKAALFGKRRGARVDNVSVFPGRENWTTLQSAYWYRALPSYFDPATDDAVVAVPLWPASNSVTDTGTDEQWRTLGSVIATADPNAYIRLGWEMNIRTAWALTRTNHHVWIRQYRRAVGLLKDTCPGCRIVWNPNHGVDRHNAYSSRAAFSRLQDLIDVYAIDDYDIHPAMTSPANQREHMNSYGQLNESLAFAHRHHKKFALPEWGISCTHPGCQWANGAGGDDPNYIHVMMQWFEAHRSAIAFESYFDDPSPQIRSSLYTRPIGPKSGARYRQEILALK